MRAMTIPLLLLLAACPKTTGTADPYAPPPKNAGVADRPEDLAYPEATFEVPDPKDFRHEVAGVPVYIAPTHEFPLVEVTFSFQGGRYLEPDGKWGVGPATADLMLHGGTATVGAGEIDERFAFLAADVDVGVYSEQSEAKINFLKGTMDDSLGLFIDMLRNPGWDADQLALYRSKTIERMKQRNDDAGNIQARTWSELAFGADHYLGRTNTAAMVESLTADDLAAFHATVFHPGNLVIGVTGDVEPDEILPVLEKALAGWEKGDRAANPPAPAHPIQPGLYHVQKDIPQGKVRIGMPGISRDDPDAIALEVMNEILGGGGFTSRLMKRIRSDEGLAYGAWSRFADRVYFPGLFEGGFDSKNPTVARATQIFFEEVARIRKEPVTEDELATTKAAMLETFPRRFETRAAIVSTFVDDELTGRDAAYWKTYREKVEAVTIADLQAVAEKHLDPEKLTILVVGDWEPIAKGDLEGKATMAPYGEPKHLPLKDPLTQEPME